MLGDSERYLWLGLSEVEERGSLPGLTEVAGSLLVLGQGRTCWKSPAGTAAGGFTQVLAFPWLGGSQGIARGTAERGIPGSTRDALGMLSHLGRGKRSSAPQKKAFPVSSCCQSLGKANRSYFEVLCPTLQ